MDLPTILNDTEIYKKKNLKTKKMKFGFFRDTHKYSLMELTCNYLVIIAPIVTIILLIIYAPKLAKDMPSIEAALKYSGLSGLITLENKYQIELILVFAPIMITIMSISFKRSQMKKRIKKPWKYEAMEHEFVNVKTAYHDRKEFK